MAYDISLEDVKVKPHQVTTLHMVCALAFIVAGTIICIYNYIITCWGAALLAAGILLACLTVFKNKWVTGRFNMPLRIIELIIALTVCIYSARQGWKFPVTIFGILSASLLFGLYWERSSGSALSVHVDEQGLRLPVTARRRHLRWTEIEEIVLRFGTLTINCVDNRFFQWSITGPDIDSTAFEAFCSGQIEANRGKRRNDDW